MTLITSPLEQRICVQLLEGKPKDVARSGGRSRWSVYKHRRRFEIRNGVTLPRLHNVGRPLKASAAVAAN